MCHLMYILVQTKWQFILYSCHISVYMMITGFAVTYTAGQNLVSFSLSFREMKLFGFLEVTES